MAKRKSNNFSRKGSESPTVDILKSIAQTPSSRTVNPGGARDLTRLAIGSQSKATGISFGSPSDRRSRGSKSGTGASWTNLLGSTSSHGISDLLGGGGLLTAGLDYLTHSITSLFGGESDLAPEPLVRFALPETQDQTVYTNGAQPGLNRNVTSGVYGNAQPSQLSQTSKAAIVQTVKNAILTSSSLNDVIGEL